MNAATDRKKVDTFLFAFNYMQPARPPRKVIKPVDEAATPRPQAVDPADAAARAVQQIRDRA